MADDEEEEKSKEDPIHDTHFLNSSQSLNNRSFSDSLTTLKNDIVFPPVNHEGLPPSPPIQTLIPSPPQAVGGGAAVDGSYVVRKWVGFGYGQLRARVLRFLSCFRHFCESGGVNRSFGCGAGAAVTAAVFVWWVYVAARRRRRDRMVLVIKEKDEKIKELLHQIAQMNQLLLSFYKSPPSQGGGVM